MNKRGIVLLLGLIVVIVLSILAAVFFKRSITESHSVRRHASSSQALWNAEQGLSQAIAALPSENDIGGPNDEIEYTVDDVNTDADSVTYRIVSTGRVFVGAAPIARTVEAFIDYVPFTKAGNFEHAIEVNNELKIQPGVNVIGTVKPDAEVSFAIRFQVSTSQMRNLAISQGHYYEDPKAPLPNFGEASGDGQVTWVKITDPGAYLQIPKNNWEGKGILVVEGNCRIEGPSNPECFAGIIWVTGLLDVRGNAYISGTIVSEASADVTDVTGTPTLEWNLDNINMAKKLLEDPFADHARLSWREVP